ncbi:MAG: HAD-IA family hydrolase [Opitutales bacterium]|nr:HAD-IA family hydrolase [Opitutales bacterium]
MKHSTQIRAVTFDIGGTLIVPEPSVGAVYAEVAQTFGVTQSPELLDARFYEGFRRASANCPSSAEKVFWETVVRHVFAPADLDEITFRRIFEAVYTTFGEGRRWRILDGVPHILQTLSERGFRLAALSNADARFHSVLRDLELTPYFEAVFLSGDIGCEKPDPRIFRHVEKALGLDPQYMLHVGDSLKHDITGAHNAGWAARLIDGPSSLAALADDPLLPAAPPPQ